MKDMSISFSRGKAHRKKQGEGIVTYVDPLLRSNEAPRKNQKTYQNSVKNALSRFAVLGL